jgi:hypothetical protein
LSEFDPQGGPFARHVVRGHFGRQGHFGQDQRIRCCLPAISRAP